VGDVTVWRAIPAALFAVEGVVLVLVAMAQARDRRGATHLTVILTGLVVLVLAAVVTVVVAVLLPPLAGWGVAFVLAIVLLALLHTN
jgi:uncharacterized membrane protein